MNRRLLGVLALSIVLLVSGTVLAQKPYQVALIIAQGGLGDLSYNDLAYAGLQRAARNFAGQVIVRTVQATDIVSQGESVLRNAARAGFDLVIDLEYSTFEALNRLAPEFPNTRFAILNAVVDQPNVTSVMFEEQEGSFLAGALAAMVTQNTSIPGINPEPVLGVIGGTKSLGIDKFIVGFIEGARYINPDIRVLVSYSNNFGDPALGRQMALALFEQGADIVYHVAGGTGQGVIDAAEEVGRYAIGVDTDQDFLAPGHVLTSMMKRADIAVYSLVEQLVNGTLQSGVLRFGLANGGVGLSPMQYTAHLLPAEYLQRLAGIETAIVDGTIQVTDITAVPNPNEVLDRLGLGH